MILLHSKGWKTMTMVKLAAATMVLGTSVVGCSPAGQALHIGVASDDQAAKLGAVEAKRANKALAGRQFVKAIGFAEAAVAAQPRDAEYRALLGQAYLGGGRFQSAETSFEDALKLDPERERAALNLALAQIALGKDGEALKTLAEYRDKLPASDFGLATALAGDTGEAIRVLEAAARSPQADAKTRQNLALAYALAGKWANAKVVAVQDLAPENADARLAEWARLAQPGTAWEQVAAVLGVHPGADTGQPARLALAPTAPSAVQVAQAEPVSSSAAVPAAELARVSAAPAAPAVDTAPKPAFEVAAARPLLRAAPTPVKQAMIPPSFTNAKPAGPLAVPFKRPVGRLGGSFVVQLGAFSNVGVAKNSWSHLSTRYGLGNYDPVNAKARVRNINFVRLAVGGFSNRVEAQTMCNRIKTAGGQCFVRAVAGDSPAQWVQRSLPKLASR